MPPIVKRIVLTTFTLGALAAPAAPLVMAATSAPATVVADSGSSQTFYHG